MRHLLKGASIAGAILLALAAPAGAVDGVIEINNARAEAGGVTPGDAPGYPVTIDSPGSYRLTGDLFVSGTNVDVLEVTADFVTIDLNGFSIRCLYVFTPCAGNGTGAGIDAASASNLTVRNGTVRDMAGDGIDAGPQAMIEQVRSQDNGGIGISIASGVLRKDIAIGNDIGFGSHNQSGAATDEYMVMDCYTSGNTQGGYFTSFDSMTAAGNYFSEGIAGNHINLSCNKINTVVICPP